MTQEEPASVTRPTVIPPDKKVRIALGVLRGEMSAAEAARRNNVSETSVARWRRLFVDAGRQALVEGGGPHPRTRDRVLVAEIGTLRAALERAHVELHVWRRGREELPPF
jgi:transposase